MAMSETKIIWVFRLGGQFIKRGNLTPPHHRVANFNFGKKNAETTNANLYMNRYMNFTYRLPLLLPT